MEDLDQGCDRRVESDPLTLNPMATANQTSGGVGSVGNGRLHMRRPARLTLHRVYNLCPYKEVFNRSDHPPLAYQQDDDHIWNKPTLS